jgi:hypothetical protein
MGIETRFHGRARLSNREQWSSTINRTADGWSGYCCMGINNKTGGAFYGPAQVLLVYRKGRARTELAERDQSVCALS